MAERRVEILVDSKATAEKLISFLTSPAVTEMLTKAGGKIEGIANFDADSLGGWDKSSRELLDNFVKDAVENTKALEEENYG